MKYNLLLKFLRFLVQIKRFFWWIGARVFFVIDEITKPLWRFLGFLHYKVGYLLKKIGFGPLGGLGGVAFKRNNLQLLIFTVLLLVAIPQTKLYAKKANYLPGQKTIAYNLSTPEEEYSLEEVVASDNMAASSIPTWRQGAIVGDINAGVSVDNNWRSQDISGLVAGGSAISKPIIMPGVNIGGIRNNPVDYIIMPGDSISSIAYQFGISAQTILWENNLSLRSLIQPGGKLRIPPTDGVMYTVKKGDTLKKIAGLYGAKTEEIIKFNKIKEDGTDLKVGDRIMVPGGIIKVAVSAPRTSATYSYKATPPSSKQAPGASGFVWPSGAKTITQYYNWTHHALDIAGKMATPNYAAKAGTVVTAQCGWNSGYGCYIIIDHGGGIKTLYGHHSQLLVSPGDHVEAGQTIGLMGNTGKVRGVTGIHLHFEIIINGVRVNPLGYVR